MIFAQQGQLLLLQQLLPPQQQLQQQPPLLQLPVSKLERFVSVLLMGLREIVVPELAFVMICLQ